MNLFEQLEGPFAEMFNQCEPGFYEVRTPQRQIRMEPDYAPIAPCKWGPGPLHSEEL